MKLVSLYHAGSIKVPPFERESGHPKSMEDLQIDIMRAWSNYTSQFKIF